MLDESQLQFAKNKLKDLEQKLTLRFNPGPDVEDPFCQALEQVVQKLAALAGSKLELVQDESGEKASEPFIQINNIKYLAVPVGFELEPFLTLLVNLSSKVTRPESEDFTGTIEILIAPTCPSCPLVVSACTQVASFSPRLQLKVIDAQYFKELAGSIRAVPTVIIDGTRTVVGPLNEHQLIEILKERGRPGYLKKSIASMIEAGRIVEAVPLLASEAGLKALAELMVEGSMQERIGLMLLTELALDREKHCLDGALPHLLPLLEAKDATLRGDVADLLGKIGAPGATSALTRLLLDENEDVREVAEESLALLRQPS